ncbi:RraA family protein [Neomoorella humiferrea]|uniref:RraA family protein n=1 Tax=Neomoorella humiferrea TaxID=676965 RepID=UPI003D93938B
MIDQSKFPLLREKLYSAVICDILDELGVRNGAMYHHIRPLTPDMVTVGRAFTMLATDVYEIPEEPYKLELEAVDSVKSGEVIVATTNGSVSSGFWGELLSTAAVGRGACGAIIDGLTRDSKRIIKMGFPVFVRGMSPYDSKGRTDVIAYQVPIVCGGVLVRPGDLVFADYDGIVVVPKEIEDEVIDRAMQKVSGENKVREELLAGVSAREVFASKRQIQPTLASYPTLGDNPLQKIL